MRHALIPRLVRPLIAFALLIASFFSATFARSCEKAPLPKAGDKPLIYATQTGEDLKALLLEAIEKAEESIWVVIYTLTDPDIIKALNNKSLNGVDVNIVCDAKACSSLQGKLTNQVHLLRRFTKGLMHQKILVIDERTSFIGSANLTLESLKMHGNVIIGFDDPTLGKTLKEHAASLDPYRPSDPLPPSTYLVAGQEVELWFLPNKEHASLKVKELIRSAKKTIKIAMFTWTRSDFAKSVIDAGRREVKVEVALDRNSAQGASHKTAELLKEGGIPLYLSSGQALLHHKMMLIDDETLLTGSANWTKAAFNENDDCFIILHHLTPQQKERVELLWSAILKGTNPGN